MPVIAYERKRFSGPSLEVIEHADRICREYANQGYDLTLRQLYYQFVARGLIENTQRSYKRLGSIVNDARMAGELDWDYIVDRTRNLEELAHWSSPSAIIDGAASQYRIAKWADQPNYVEVWVEKEALAGVVERIARELDVAYFSCRGYVSQSEMWRAGRRLADEARKGKNITVLHLGDHDPSGIDMSRDIADRLHLFAQSYAHNIEVDRIALTREQVDILNPPPNPAKLSDSRAADYVAEHGYQSWELDALDPATLATLIRDRVTALRDDALWAAQVRRERRERDGLVLAADRWDEIVEFLGAGEDE